MFSLVYITCNCKEEANRIAEFLIKEKLVACVNSFPVSSIFFWNGKIERCKEYTLICKTTKSKFEEIKRKVKEIHSYEKPAILSISVEGDEDFLKWIKESVQ